MSLAARQRGPVRQTRPSRCPRPSRTADIETDAVSGCGNGFDEVHKLAALGFHELHSTDRIVIGFRGQDGDAIDQPGDLVPVKGLSRFHQRLPRWINASALQRFGDHLPPAWDLPPRSLSVASTDRHCCLDASRIQARICAEYCAAALERQRGGSGARTTPRCSQPLEHARPRVRSDTIPSRD